MEHHFVPRFYLNAFCDPATPAGQASWVWVVDLEERTIRRRAPKNVARKTDYYAVPDAAQRHELEKVLGTIESSAAPILARLLKGQLEIAGQERADLAYFVSFLATRGPFFRGIVEKFSAEVAERMMFLSADHKEHFERTYREANPGKEFTAEEVEQARQMILTSGFKVRAKPIVSLLPLLEVAEDIYPLLVGMEWAFFVPVGETGFLTCDTPVSWVDPTLPPGPYGSGLAMRNVEVTFPIGPRLCLIATWREGNTGHAEVDDAIVRELNRRRVSFAHRSVFADSEVGARDALDIFNAMRA